MPQSPDETPSSSPSPAPSPAKISGSEEAVIPAGGWEKGGKMKREMTLKQGNGVCYPAPFEFHISIVLRQFDWNLLASFWQDRGRLKGEIVEGGALVGTGKSAD